MAKGTENTRNASDNLGDSSHFAVRWYLPVFLMLLLFAGCTDRDKIHEQLHRVEETGWHSNDFLSFRFDVSDTTIPYNFYLDIRNSVDYPYANIFLFIRTILPDRRIANDTLDIWLADPEGKWLGGGIGRYRDRRVLIMPSFMFPAAGEYVFELEHAMREPDLIGIAGAGIRVERAERN
jgi:gliding motility-associated lipoprotein GldH